MITDEKFVKDFYEILEDKEIKPAFQPIVSLATGEVYGYEALSSALMKLGISYGQGYYLGKPNSEFLEVPKQIQKKVLDMKKKDRQISIVPSFFGTVDSICKREQGIPI